MTSPAANYYTVVHYVPDPATDEKLNVGLIAFGEHEIDAVFLRNWRRAQQFGDGDIDFLKDFARRIAQASDPQLLLPDIGETVSLTPELIREMTGQWINSIQFSEPRASLLPLERITREIGQRLLREPQRRRRRFRDKRVATRAAEEALERVLEEHGESPERYLKRGLVIEGSLDQHTFDIGLANGQALLGVETLSFEGAGRHMKREVEATAWALDDVHKRVPKLALAVVALPPKSRSDTYRRARHIFEGLSAEVVEEDDVHDWSSERVPQLIAEFIGS